MKLKEYISTPIAPKDFIQHINILGLCDYLYTSDFFCTANFAHFGISNLSQCIKEAPNESCIVMCRFREGEIYRLLDSCAQKKQYKYIIVQTLIGDDGYISPEMFNRIPSNIVAIYAKNIVFPHPKIFHIPIGRDWRNTEENNTITYIKNKRANNLAYLNFSIQTCPDVRGKVYGLFASQNWVTSRLPECHKNYPISHTEYLAEMSQHNFCFSPVGFALDCYRTWDALFAKVIPIVDHNYQVDFYSSLPILYTNDWSEISEQYLLDKYNEMLETDYNFELSMTSFWKQKFNQLRNQNF